MCTSLLACQVRLVVKCERSRVLTPRRPSFTKSFLIHRLTGRVLRLAQIRRQVNLRRCMSLASRRSSFIAYLRLQVFGKDVQAMRTKTPRVCIPSPRDSTHARLAAVSLHFHFFASVPEAYYESDRIGETKVNWILHITLKPSPTHIITTSIMWLAPGSSTPD